MKVASGPLIAYLNSGSVFQMALLYTITLLGGGVYRWTSADLSIVFGGNTFTSAIDQGGQPLIQRGPIRTVKGLEVDTLDITLLCGDTAQILGGNLTLAAHNGAFDGARVKVERLFMPSWGDTSLGSLVEFEGAVAGVDPASQQVILHVMSDLEKLQLQMPHVLFMPACANSFGDPACGIVLSTLTATGTAGASTNASQVTNVTGHVDGYYNLGVIAMKVFGQEQLLKAAPVEKLLAYALSLPVSLASVGMPQLEHIERNAAFAREFTPMSTRERSRLVNSIERGHQLAMAEFFRDHQDA